MMSSIKLEPCLRSLKKSVKPELKQSSDALNLLSYIFNDLSGTLVRDTLSAYNHAKRKPLSITPDYARRAVKKSLKAKIGVYAEFEGQRAVDKFSRNILHYDGKKAERSAAKMKAKKSRTKARTTSPATSLFARGIKLLLFTIGRCRYVELDAKRNLGTLLLSICRNLVDHASKNTTDKNVLTLDDVRNTVNETFGTQMALHAHLEGQALVSRFYDSSLVMKIRRKAMDRDVAGARRSSQKAQRVPTGPRNSFSAVSAKSTRFFGPRLRKLAVEVQATPPLDRQSVRFVDGMLSTVLKSLVHLSIDSAGTSPDKQLTLMDSELSVGKILPPAMAEMGMSEGRRAVALYSSGVLSVRFKKRVGSDAVITTRSTRKKVKRSSEKREIPKRRLSKRRSRCNLRDFSRGILQMMATRLTSIDRPANENLAKILLTLCEKLAMESASNHDNKILGNEAVITAVSRLFSGRQREHLITAGDAAIVKLPSHEPDISKPEPEPVRLAIGGQVLEYPTLLGEEGEVEEEDDDEAKKKFEVERAKSVTSGFLIDD